MYGSGELEVQIYGKAAVGSSGRGQQTQARFWFPMRARQFNPFRISSLAEYDRF